MTDNFAPSAPPPSFDPPALPSDGPAVPPSFSGLSEKAKRDKVAFEILDTERSYVSSLEHLVKFYMKPLQTESIFSKQQQKTVFGNVDHILIINKELLDALEKRMKIWEENDALGDVLNKLIPWLRLYSEYCANYQNSNAILTKAIEKSSSAEWFNNTKDKNGILDIFSLLIMPIQRIPRYKLLLEQLLKYTPDYHPDFTAVTNALAKIEVVANLINEGVRKQEHKEQMEELAKRLTGKLPKHLITPSRFLVHEGELTKLCRKVPKKRQFFLFNDLLLYGEGNSVHLSINLNSAKVTPLEDSEKAKNAFKLMSKEKSFVFWADTPEEKTVWANKFETAAQSRAKIKSITLGDEEKKQEAGPTSEEFAPQWQNDGESNVCPLCQIKFTTIRRKHHCRKCGTLACAKCSEHKFELPSIGKERVCDDCYFELSGVMTRRKVLRDKIANNRMSMAISAQEAFKMLEADEAKEKEAAKKAKSSGGDPRKIKKSKKDKKSKDSGSVTPTDSPRASEKKEKDLSIERNEVSPPPSPRHATPVPASAPATTTSTTAPPKASDPLSVSEIRKRPVTSNFESFRGKPLPPPPGGAGANGSPRGTSTMARQKSPTLAGSPSHQPATQSAVLIARSHEAPPTLHVSSMDDGNIKSNSSEHHVPHKSSISQILSRADIEAAAAAGSSSASLTLSPPPVPNKKKPQPRVPLPNRPPPRRPVDSLPQPPQQQPQQPQHDVSPPVSPTSKGQSSARSLPAKPLPVPPPSTNGNSNLSASDGPPPQLPPRPPRHTISLHMGDQQPSQHSPKTTPPPLPPPNQYIQDNSLYV